jgi:hypothetical protein
MSTLNFPTSPSLNDTYSFGTKTWIWNGSAWQLNRTGAINDIPVGNITPASGAFTTLTANSTITAVGNITGSYFIGNGSQLTGLPEGYGNADVAAYLPTYTGNLVSLTGNVTTTANISGSYILGNGSQLTGLPASGLTWTTQANAAPAGPAPGDFWYDAYTGVKYQYINDGTSNIWVDQSFPTSFSTLAVAGNATIGGNLGVTGNITGAYLIGNGSQLTGLPAGYTDSNVVTLLSSFGSNTISTTGNITAGNAATGIFNANSAVVANSITVNSGNLTTAIVNGGSNGVGNIGSAAGSFNTIFAKATSAQYADLAEIYSADQNYTPGTVIVFGGTHEVTVSNVSHDIRAAGVVSTKPAYVMNSTAAGVAVALTGRVPCQVRGPVAKGEQLVNIEPGIAGAVDFAQYRPGCVIGKSLETIEDSAVHTIEIAVGRY